MNDTQAFDDSRFVIRRFSVDDLDALGSLLRAAPETARYPDEVSPEALVAQWNWPGHVPERDRWVVVERADPARLLGFGAIFKPPTMPRADLLDVTHPAARGQGIGTTLLRLALADAATLGATDATLYVNDLDVQVAMWAQRRGFAPVSAFTVLVADGARAFPPPIWSTGMTIRPWRGADDLATLVEASNRCYAGLWGHNVTTADEWSRWLPEMDTRGIFFLFAEQRGLVGMVRASLRMDAQSMRIREDKMVGIVDAPGVVAEARGKGLYRPLLLHAIAWLAEERPDQIRVESWGDDPAVIAQYRDLGFSETRRETLYRRTLTS
ncbi:MAG TPA: GNAT family N-acetyltransferase [Ktedonobacterales bacterium]|nr:GNAT family N-acetyltransferase [Ktedonobacterales bacterium]